MGIFDSVRQKLSSKTEGASIDSVESQPQEDKDLCGFIKSQVEDVRSQANRIAHEGIWMTNIAYLLGFDSVFYDPTMRQFKPLNKSSGFVKRNRIHSNLLLAAVQNRAARLCKNPPRYDTRPNSTDQEDKDAAKLGIEVINMVWDKEHINRKRLDLVMWLQECGHAYVKVCWDPDLGEDLVDPETGENKGKAGDIRVDVVSAFECFADPLAKTLEECSWFSQCKVRKLEYFRTHYPERGSLVKEEGAWLLSTQYEQRINTLNSVGPASSGTQEQMKNAAIEINYYQKPTKKYQKGRHIIAANGVLLENKYLPCGEIPFAKFDDVIIGGKYYSEALTTHARPLQDQYNRTLVKRAEWINKLLTGKYIAARGHNLIQEGINDQSGEVVFYDPVPNANEPHAMQIPVIPAYAYTESDTIKKEIFDIYGLSEISRGQLPSSSIPAIGMQLLLEQDETRIGIEVEQHEHAWARIGQLILKYADKYYLTDRALKTKGRNAEYQVRYFNGSMLRKNFDVTVIRGSTVPNSKVIRRQEILNVYTQGLLGNPQDPSVREKVLGMLEYGEAGEAWTDYNLDMTQIQDTLKEIEEGSLPEVNKADNHMLHLVMKNRYRKGDKFKTLSPISQKMLEMDMDTHVKWEMALKNPSLMQPPVTPAQPFDPHLAQEALQKTGQVHPGVPIAGLPPQMPAGA